MQSATKYSPGQLAQFRATFKPQAERYRLRSNLFLPAYFLCFGGATLLRFCPGWTRLIPIAVLCAGIVLLLVAMFTSMPHCPACDSKLVGGIATHCPECGSASVIQTRGGMFQAHQCQACGKMLRCGKGRTFQIRACTHCGVVLDDNGL